MINILEESGENVEFIFHVSDIHIRLYTRHLEYTKVFSKLYNYISEFKREGKCCVCVITGDILHSKTDLSPELEKMTCDFFSNLSVLFPTFLIAGNHDGLIHNPDRIDSISSILYERDIQNCYYLKKTGIYQFRNLRFFLDALFDKDVLDMTTEGVETMTRGYKNIGLYHGQIRGWRNLKGYVSSTGEKYLEQFTGMDYVLLGDIHYFHYISREKPITAYASSLISQNFNEYDKSHGYLLWNVMDDTQEYIVIENEYRHQIVEISDENRFITDGCEFDFDHVEIASCGKIKVIGNEDEISSREHFLRLKHKFPDACFSYQMKQGQTQVHSLENDEEDTEEIIMSEYDIILSYIKSKCSSEYYKEFSKYVLNLFKENQPISNNIQYKLKEISFSNMFGYGGENYINLSNYFKSIIGVFGANTYGKSTIIDIISILLYDKIARYSHGAGIPKEVIHFEEKHAWGKLVLVFGAKEYIIHKEYSRSVTGKIMVKSKLFMKENGETTELTGEQRRVTNKTIQEMLGSFDNFMFFNAYLQQKEVSFREMTSLSKKKFLNSIYGYDFLESFEKLHKENLKSKEIEFKLYQDQQEKHVGLDYQVEMEKVQKDLRDFKDFINKYKTNVEDYESKINNMNRQLSTSVDDFQNDMITLEQIEKEIQDCVLEREKLNLIMKSISELNYKENLTVLEKDELFKNFSENKENQDEFFVLYENVYAHQNIQMEILESKLKKYYSKIDHERHDEIDKNILSQFLMEEKDILKEEYMKLSGNIKDILSKIKQKYNAMYHPYDEISMTRRSQDEKDFLVKKKRLEKDMKDVTKELDLYKQYELFQSRVDVEYYRKNYKSCKESDIFLKYSPMGKQNRLESWELFKKKTIPKDLNYKSIQMEMKKMEKEIDQYHANLQEVVYENVELVIGNEEEWKKREASIRETYLQTKNDFQFTEEIHSEMESIFQLLDKISEMEKKISFLDESLQSCKEVKINTSCEICVQNKWYQKQLKLSKELKAIRLEYQEKKIQLKQNILYFKDKYLLAFQEDAHVRLFLNDSWSLLEFKKKKTKYNEKKRMEMEWYALYQKKIKNDEKKKKHVQISKKIKKIMKEKNAHEEILKSILDYISNKHVYSFLDYQWKHTFGFDIDFFLSMDCQHDEKYNHFQNKKSELLLEKEKMEKEEEESIQIWEKDFQYKKEIDALEKQIDLHQDYELWFREIEKMEKQKQKEGYKKKIEELEVQKKFVHLYENKKNVLDFLYRCFHCDTWKQHPENTFLSFLQETSEKIKGLSLLIEELKIKRKNLESDIQILEKINEYQNAKNNFKKMMENMDLKRGNLLSKYEEIQINQTIWQENNQKLYKISLDIKKEKELITILEKDGLPLHLLKQKMSLVEQKMNEIMNPFSSKHVSFRIGNDKNSIDFGFTNSNHIISSFISGMEAFLLDICLKFCLSYFYIRPKSNIFIIDEKVSVLDKDKLSNISSLFEFLKMTSTNVLVISHIEIVKDYVDTSMEVKKQNNKSLIRFQ